jgi:hypothetical protein
MVTEAFPWKTFDHVEGVAVHANVCAAVKDDAPVLSDRFCVFRRSVAAG